MLEYLKIIDPIASSAEAAGEVVDPLLQYSCRRIAELENLLLVEVPETVWPAVVGLV